MDVMKLKTAFVALGALVAVSVPAAADGIKDVGVPAPIPVPGAIPVREGFSYYLRADLGYAWAANNASFSENGSLFGTGAPPFRSVPPFAFGSFLIGAATTE